MYLYASPMTLVALLVHPLVCFDRGGCFDTGPAWQEGAVHPRTAELPSAHQQPKGHWVSQQHQPGSTEGARGN